MAFIGALAATGCVEEAARHVGMSSRSARELRNRRDADSLRTAWDASVAVGIGRLAEAAMSRAIHGVPQPIFYKGEQVGEHRRYDERLTTFLLRCHAPHRYGAWRDKAVVQQGHPDRLAMLLQEALKRLAVDCVADMAGRPRPKREALRTERTVEEFDDPEVAAEEAKWRAQRRQDERDLFEHELAALRDEWEEEARAEITGSSEGDGTSGPPHEGNLAFAAGIGGGLGTSEAQPADPPGDA